MVHQTMWCAAIYVPEVPWQCGFMRLFWFNVNKWLFLLFSNGWKVANALFPFLCLDFVMKVRYYTGGDQMLLTAAGDIMHQGCDSRRLWRSGLCRSMGMKRLCGCLCSLWVFDFHVNIYVSIALLWKCLSPPDWWSVVLLGLSWETSQALCQLQRCLFNALSSSEEAKLLR